MKYKVVAQWVLVAIWAAAILFVWVGGRQYGAVAWLITLATIVILLHERKGASAHRK
jgi:hypothetical protein